VTYIFVFLIKNKKFYYLYYKCKHELLTAQPSALVSSLAKILVHRFIHNTTGVAIAYFKTPTTIILIKQQNHNHNHITCSTHRRTAAVGLSILIYLSKKCCYIQKTMNCKKKNNKKIQNTKKLSQQSKAPAFCCWLVPTICRWPLF
jgi:hypothetical protein